MREFSTARLPLPNRSYTSLSSPQRTSLSSEKHTHQLPHTLSALRNRHRETIANNLPIVLLTIAITCQIGLVAYLGTEKAENNGVRIDEMYSYIFANSYDGDNISQIDSYWEQWIDGNALMETITVQKGERFSYDKVYYNNSVDCHPPLFYALLHTICSLFPNKYTIWFGIILNMILMIIADVLIYLLTRELTNNKVISVLPVVLWGISFACMNTVLFIRMYMLLTTCSLAFLYIAVRCKKYGLNLKRCFSLFLVSLLGVFTHYFFILFAFFVTLLYCVSRFAGKKFKEGIFFGATVSFSVALLLILYPYVITQATGSKTNNIGNEVSRSILNFSTLPGKIIDFIKWFAHRFFNKYTFFLTCVFIFFCIALLGVLSFIKNKHIKIKLTDDVKLIISLTIATMTTAVTSLHVAGIYATERYIYNLYPILAVLLISFTYKIIENFANLRGKLYIENSVHETTKNFDGKTVCSVALSFLVLLNASMFAVKPSCKYLFETEKNIVEKIVNQNAKNCIVITSNSKTTDKRSTIVPTTNVIRFNNFEKIYLTTGNTMKNLDSILQDINYNNGVLVYLTTDTDWMDGYEPDSYMPKLIQQTDTFSDYQFVEDVDFGKLYLLKK